jgi:uncharacterized membrane protein (UPF0136 family)
MVFIPDMHAQDDTHKELTQYAKWVAGYGIFLIAVGLLGYLSNPAQAKTALISGGTFGTIHIIFGLFLYKGIAIARWMALTVASLLSLIFLWRSSVSWMAVPEDSGKLTAAVLISSMLVASVALIWKLWPRRAAN